MAIACSSPQPANAAGFVRDGLESTHVYSRWIYIEQGEYVICTTSNSTTGTDPAIHLWHSSNGEVASGFDYGSTPEALMAYANNGSNSYFRLIIRTEHNDSFNVGGHGETDVSCSFSGIEPNFTVNDSPVGGVLALSIPDPGDYFEVAMAPGGPQDTMLLALDSSGQLLQFEDYGGLRFMAGMDAPSGAFLSLVGVPHYRTLGKFTQTEGHVTLYGNDAASGDADGDGLGADLEALLMTCDSATTHSYCASIPNLQDSDGDGLRDDWEVFGEDRPYPQADNFFSYWGAEPAQKDVFVEVDWLASVSSGVSVQPHTQSPFLTDGSSEVETWYDLIEDPFRHGSDTDLANPNGQNGMQIHLDVGFDPDPAASAYADAFGDWGGGGTAVHFTNDGSYSQMYAGAMAVGRRGRFHYGVAFKNDSGGGQAGGGDPPAFRFGYDASQTRTGAATFAHELGHSLSLGHNHYTSSLNHNPLYLSLMNYSFSYDYPLRFSSVDAAESGTVNAAASHEYGDIVADNFPELPGTSYFLDRFLGDDSPYRPETYVGEHSFTFFYFPLLLPMIDWNQDGVFGGSPTTGAEDDPAVRSGLLLPAGTNVGLMEDETSVVVNTQTTPIANTPVLAFNGDYLFVLYVEGGKIRYKSTEIDGLDDASCLTGDDSPGSSCHPMQTSKLTLDDSPLTSGVEDVRVVRQIPNISNGQPTDNLILSVLKTNGDILACVATGDSDELSISACSSALFPESASGVEIAYVHERSGGVKKPSLAIFGTFDIPSLEGLVVYRVLDGTNPTLTADWSTYQIPYDTNQLWLTSADDSAVSIAAWPPIEDYGSTPSDGSTCLAIQSRATDTVTVYCTEDATGGGQRWKDVGPVRTAGYSDPFGEPDTVAEPWLEFVRERRADGTRRWADPRVGRFLLTYVHETSAANVDSAQYRHSDLMGPRLDPGFEEYSPVGSNAWRFDFGMGMGDIVDDGAGISVLDASGVGATKGAVVRPPTPDENDPTPPNRTTLLWGFDGAVDHEWSAHNDFDRVAENMCTRVNHAASTDQGGFVCD